MTVRFKNLPRISGEGDHEVVEGALVPAQCGGSAPSVSYAATSPASGGGS